MGDPARAIAVFDFDHTLIEGDSLWPFLTAITGPLALWALAQTLLLFARRHLQNAADPELADFRTFVKAELLRRLLAGKRADGFGSATERLRRWMKWNERVRRAFLDHAAKGHRLVVISGALDLYLPALTKDLPPHDLVCTRMEIKDGVMTGVMVSGNCVRARKAEMLAAYLQQNGPFVESWGYGNLPHDLPMLSLLERRIVV